VTNRWDFTDALRSQRYGTIVVLDDGHLRMDIGILLRKEVKAQVASGGSFVLLSAHDGRWKDIVGAKPRGPIHRLSSVELPDSPASNASSFEFVGRGSRVWLDGGVPVGTLNENAEYPAMVLNSVGTGNSILVNFDPSDITEEAEAEVVMTNILAYATSSRTQQIAGEYGNLTWLASELDAPLSVELAEELSVDVSFVEVFDGTITSPNTAFWVRDVAETEEAFTAIVKLPAEKGTYQSSVDLYEILDSGKNLLLEDSLDIEIAYDRGDISVDLMSALSSLDLPDVHDRVKRDIALDAVQRALAIEIRNRRDVEFVLRHLLHAYGILEHIKEPIPEVLSDTGLLIRAYQLEWYALPK
jgi:hypothetical protein